jgi:predicted phosphodiesterase
MRYAVLADVHGNLEALSAVLDSARSAGAQRFVCAGDLVGYHADPDACVERLRAVAAVCVAGNHDRVAAGIAEPHRFGAAARRAVLWTREHLAPASRAYLAGLPLHRVVDGRFLLVHAALHPTPNADLHLSSHARIARSIEALRDGPWGVSLAFFGHTHRAVVHEASGGAFRSRGGEMQELSLSIPGAHYLVNPGSVGQPRDGDPRAAFALLDVDGDHEGAFTLRFRRVAFDAGACHAKAARAGLEASASPLTRLRAALRRLS